MYNIKYIISRKARVRTIMCLTFEVTRISFFTFKNFVAKPQPFCHFFVIKFGPRVKNNCNNIHPLTFFCIIDLKIKEKGRNAKKSSNAKQNMQKKVGGSTVFYTMITVLIATIRTTLRHFFISPK